MREWVCKRCAELNPDVYRDAILTQLENATCEKCDAECPDGLYVPVEHSDLSDLYAEWKKIEHEDGYDDDFYRGADNLFSFLKSKLEKEHV